MRVILSPQIWKVNKNLSFENTSALCTHTMSVSVRVYVHTTKHSAAASCKLKEMSVVVCTFCSYILVISAETEFMTEFWYSKWRN